MAWYLVKNRDNFTFILLFISLNRYMNLYPKVSGLAAWSETCKWHSSLQLRAVVSLFCESV